MSGTITAPGIATLPQSSGADSQAVAPIASPHAGVSSTQVVGGGAPLADPLMTALTGLNHALSGLVQAISGLMQVLQAQVAAGGPSAACCQASGGGGAAGHGGGVVQQAPPRGAAAAPSAPSAAVPSTVTASPGTPEHSAQVVAKVAREAGVDPALAVAMMLVESGGDPRAVGDGGTSFGLFQLHQGGLLTSAGLTPAQAFDPETNARAAVLNLKKALDGGTGGSPGQIAAAAQRPANKVAYAQKVDGNLERARQLIGA